MNQMYFEFPFLHINNYQIMPSLIVFLIFLVILGFWFFLGMLSKTKSNIEINILLEKNS